MSKEIQKNRMQLIRHFITTDNKKRESVADCAKCRALECFGKDPNKEGLAYAGRSMNEDIDEILDQTDMTEDQWHEMEKYFEGWDKYAGQGERQFREVAFWLQELPGWPKVI